MACSFTICPRSKFKDSPDRMETAAYDHVLKMSDGHFFWLPSVTEGASVNPLRMNCYHFFFFRFGPNIASEKEDKGIKKALRICP